MVILPFHVLYDSSQGGGFVLSNVEDFKLITKTVYNMDMWSSVAEVHSRNVGFKVAFSEF